MVSKKIKYIYTIGVSVFLTYAYFLISNYGKISDTVVTHIDYSGNPDGYGEKYNLIIALLVNAILGWYWLLLLKIPNMQTILLKLPMKIAIPSMKK